jgi:hypothetical protein
MSWLLTKHQIFDCTVKIQIYRVPNLSHCENTVSRKCEYGVLEIKNVKSRVEDELLDKTFVSRVISKTPYSHFRTHSISIVEKYKQAIRNYKWKEISHVTVKVNEVTCEYIDFYLTA